MKCRCENCKLLELTDEDMEFYAQGYAINKILKSINKRKSYSIGEIKN